MRTSTTARSGSCSLTAARSRSASSTPADHVVAGVLEESRQARSQQRLVLGDHYPHGSSAVTTVPASGELSTLPPAQRRHSVPHADEARSVGSGGTADAVVAHRDDEVAVAPVRAHGDRGRARVLDDVREGLAGDEVRRRLDAVLEALVGRLDRGPQGRPRRELLQRGGQAVVEPGGPDPPGQLPELLDRIGQLRDGGVDLGRRTGRRRQQSLDMAQRQPDRDEALLCPVVEVALEPPSLSIPRSHDPRPRVLDLGEPAPHLGAQPADLDREPGGSDDALEEVWPPAERLVVDERGELAGRRGAPASASGPEQPAPSPPGRSRRRGPPPRGARTTPRARDPRERRPGRDPSPRAPRAPRGARRESARPSATPRSARGRSACRPQPGCLRGAA